MLETVKQVNEILKNDEDYKQTIKLEIFKTLSKNRKK